MLAGMPRSLHKVCQKRSKVLSRPSENPINTDGHPWGKPSTDIMCSMLP